DYNTSEKVEGLFKDLFEETPLAKEGDKPEKKVKPEFLTFIGKSSLQEFLKDKEPNEVLLFIGWFSHEQLSLDLVEISKELSEKAEAIRQLKTEVEQKQALQEQISRQEKASLNQLTQ
ncbi:3806_t:CDS:2, partial [Gigaspora rosea]